MRDAKMHKEHLTRLHQLAAKQGLSGIELRTEGGIPVLAVAGETFARLLDASTAELHCPIDQKVLLMDISPAIYFQTEQETGKSVVLIDLREIADEELALRLHDAWQYRAPAR